MVLIFNKPEMKFEIQKYNSAYDPGIKFVEDHAIQGDLIQLKILKEHFRDRVKVFPTNEAFVAVNDQNIPIGTFVSAATQMIVNGEQFNAGIGFETKVLKKYGNLGIGQKMVKHAYQHFFIPHELKKNFTTMKASNKIALALTLKAITNGWKYTFVYMTIPTGQVLKNTAIHDNNQLFNVTLFNEGEADSTYFKKFQNGLSYFKTYRMYRVKIEKMSPIIKAMIWLAKKLKLKKSEFIPKEKSILSFATLYNANSSNVLQINTLMADLKKDNIDYLMVCCKKNDWLYHMFKSISIDEYSYYIISDFPLKESDEITIDVRCL
jgi:hypothetical protein